jgi:diacylglycerol kinase (ATP)
MKVLLIINPLSGGVNKHHIIKEIQALFSQQNHDMDVYETSAKQDATRVAKERATQYDAVIACGGDGTINEVINGIAEKGVPLGIIPAGTENVLAKELGIPSNYRKAAQQILRGKKCVFDLGKANKRYFALMAGIGYDAHIASQVELLPLIKNLFGSAAYPLAALKDFFNYNHPKLRVQVNGKTYTGYFVIVANSRYYGRVFEVAHKANMQDGLLDVCIFQDLDLYNLIRYFVGVVTKKHDTFQDVHYMKAKQVRITGEHPVLAHVDCELIGKTPVEVEVCPNAITIFC